MRFAAGMLLTGAAGALFAAAFRYALHHATALLTGDADVLVAFSNLGLVARVAIPAAGGAVAALIASRVKAGGHGVAAILESVALGRGEIRLPTVLVKAVASLAALATGGSIGREGSIIQFGAGSGSTFSRLLGLNEKDARILVAAGTGAGFAAAYNTPLAAVLFVVEIVTGVLGPDVVIPTAVACATSTTLTRLVIGGQPIYGRRAFMLLTQEELIAYCAVGVLAGIVGPAFIGALSAAEDAVRAVRLPRFVKGALGGAVVGALALRLPEVTGNGYEAIQQILDARLAGQILAVLLVAKAAATVASVSSGSPGGVFTPSMFLGAALGGLCGSAVPHIFAHRASQAAAGGYALAGMAGVIASTTHAPFMAAALAFELSGDYSLVIPLLLGTAIAAAIARRLRPDSIYTQELRAAGTPWRGSLTERLARAVQARDILTLSPPQVAPDAPIAEALRLLSSPDVRVVYVPGTPLRAIDLGDAKRIWAGAVKPVCAADAAHTVEPARPDETLLDLSEKLWAAEWGELPVVEGERLVGVVTRRALLGAMDREILQRDVLLTRVVRFEGATEVQDFLELPPGERAEEVPLRPGAPIALGRLRALALRRAGRARVEPLPQGYVPGPGDRLLVVGPPEEIAKFLVPAADSPA